MTNNNKISKKRISEYLKYIKKRDIQILQHISNVNEWNLSDNIFEKIKNKLIEMMVGNPCNFDRCLSFNKRQQFIRCTNSARDIGLCSHHCNWDVLSKTEIRKRDRFLFRHLNQIIKQYGIKTLPFEIIQQYFHDIEEYKKCSYKLKLPSSRCCKNLIFKNGFCKKHSMILERDKCIVIKAESTKNTNTLKKKDMNMSLHRLYGPKGFEKCYCCDKTIHQLKWDAIMKEC